MMLSMLSLKTTTLECPDSVNLDFSSSSGVFTSTASISVRGTRQSLTLMLEKSSAFWKILTSLSISSFSSAFSSVDCIRLFSSVFVNVVSRTSSLILTLKMRSRRHEQNVVNFESG